MEKKQNTQEGMAFFPGPMPQKGTHVRLGLGGLLSWTQYAAQEAGFLCEQKRGPSIHRTWGVTQESSDDWENVLHINTEPCRVHDSSLQSKTSQQQAK